MSRWRAPAAEGLGTCLLLAIIVGSGVMAERLAGGNGAIALLANSLATAAGLVALILAFGPASGAHLNPVVSLAEALAGGFAWRALPGYALAQGLGAFAGVALAHAMFGLPAFTVSAHARPGLGQGLGEFVATFGLCVVVLSCSRSRPAATPFAVGGMICAGYWFTSSTSFANPAVTLARSLSDTFAGIAPAGVLAFVIAQLIGALAAFAFARWMWPKLEGSR